MSCSRPTAPGSGQSTSGAWASARRASTSSLCATIWKPWTGTRPRRGPNCPPGSSSRPSRATARPKADCWTMTDPGAVRVTADSVFSRLTAIVLFLTLALGLTVPGALDFGTAALVVLAIGWLTVGGHWRSQGLHRLERLFVIAIVIFLLAW